MLPEDFVRSLRCPVTGSALRCVHADLLNQINQAISTQRVTNRVGDWIERPLSDGLANQDDSLVYPVWDDIPTIIPDQALEMSQFRVE